MQVQAFDVLAGAEYGDILDESEDAKLASINSLRVNLSVFGRGFDSQRAALVLAEQHDMKVRVFAFEEQ